MATSDKSQTIKSAFRDKLAGGSFPGK